MKSTQTQHFFHPHKRTTISCKKRCLFTQKNPFLYSLKNLIIFVITNYYITFITHCFNLYNLIAQTHKTRLTITHSNTKKRKKTAPPPNKIPANPQKSAIFSLFTGQNRAKIAIFHILTHIAQTSAFFHKQIHKNTSFLTKNYKNNL